MDFTGFMSGNVGVPGAKVSDRLLAVLGAFTVAHPALTLSEIAAQTEIPLSTVRRIVVD